MDDLDGVCVAGVNEESPFFVAVVVEERRCYRHYCGR